MTTLIKDALVITMLISTATTRLLPIDDNSQQRLSRPAPYSFAYGVASHPELVRYGHREESNGDSVRGAYSIALPDGRTQTVEYEADPIHGYTAKVTYEPTPGYIRPPTSTQDTLASGTTPYNHLPIVQMERSAHKPKPSTKALTQQPQVQLAQSSQWSAKQPKLATKPHIHQPQVQLAQSSQLVATNKVLPRQIRRAVAKVLSTQTSEPRHVTVLPQEIRRAVAKVLSTTTSVPRHVLPKEIRRTVAKVLSTTTSEPRHVLPKEIRRRVAKVLSTTTSEPRHVTVHQMVAHHDQNASARATVHRMFTLPWHKLLRVPASKTRISAANNKSFNSFY